MLGLRQEQHVADHARQALVFLGVGLQHLAVLVGVAGAGQRDLGFGHQVADRRTQFVGQVGRKILEPLKRIFEAGQHVVQGLREFGQLERNRIEWQAIVEAAGGDAGRALADGVQGCQAAPDRGPAEQAGQRRGDGDELPQRAAERGHEVLVVRDVHRHRDQHRRAARNTGWQQRRNAASRLPAGRPVLLPELGTRRTRDGIACQQCRRKADARSGEQGLSRGIVNHDVEIVMADQRVVELRRQGGELGRRLDFFQQVGGQMQFAVHQIHILLDEVLFDGIADQQAERQQHRGRGRCEQQGQAQGDRFAARTHPASSSST
jgi:hypothetical protein